MTWDFEKHAIEAAEEAECAVLTPEEDEPDFGPLLDKAKDHLKNGILADLPLVQGLLDMIDHLEGEIEALNDHISDHGPPYEDRDNG